MARVTIIIGLPAAGKSTYIRETFPNIDDTHNFDDYHCRAKDDSPFFEKSRRYLHLVRAVIKNEDCVLSDVEWCDCHRLDVVFKSLEEIENVFRVSIERQVHYFENDPEACQKNALKRNRLQHQEEIDKIHRLAKIYRPSTAIKLIPVRTE